MAGLSLIHGQSLQQYPNSPAMAWNRTLYQGIQQGVPGLGAPTTTTGGSGSVGTGSTGTNPVPSVDPFMQEIDNTFNSTNSYLDQAAQKYQSDYPTLVNEANAQYDAQQSSLDTQNAQGQRQIDQATAEGGTRKEDALTQARRLYNDMIRSGVQRFGGQPIQQAYSELLGQEQQRNYGTIQQGYEQTMQKVNEMGMQLKERYDVALQQLQVARDGAINEARRNLDNKLLEIASMKAQNEQAKGQMRLSALQEYRNQVFQWNLQEMSYKQQLDQQAQAANQELTAWSQFATQTGQGATDTASAYNPQATSTLSLSGQQSPSTSNQTYTGVTSQRDDEDYLKQLTGRNYA